MTKNLHPSPEACFSDRSLRLDNVKGVLIVLVVIFHASFTFQGAMFSDLGSIMDCFGHVIKQLRMPAFIFISGYLSSSRRGILHAASTVGVIFILMHVSVLGWRAIWGDFSDGFTRDAVTSGQGFIRYLKLGGGGTFWYLLYLVVWRSFVPLFAAIRWPMLTVVFSFLLGVVAQLRGQDIVFMYTPFFLAGFYSRLRHWGAVDKLRKGDLKTYLIGLGCLGSIGLCLMTYWMRFSLSGSVLWQCASYFSNALVACFSIRLLLGLMTDSRTFLTRLGASTLPIYIGHTFVLDLFKRLFLGPTANFFILMGGSVLIVVLLFGHPRLIRPIQKLCRKISGLVFNDISTDVSGPREIAIAKQE